MDLRTETVGLVLVVKTKKDFKISFEFQYIFTIHNDPVQLADRNGHWAQYAHQLDRNTGGVTGGAVAPPRPTPPPPPPPRPIPPVTTPSNQSVGLTREQERSGNTPQWTASGWAAPPPVVSRPPNVPQMNEHFGYSRNEYRYGGGAQWTSSGWAAGKTSLQIQAHIIATHTRNVCATNCLVTIFGHQITFTRDLYESLTQNSNFVRSHDLEIAGLVAVLMQHPLMSFANATRIISETMLTLGIRPGLFDAIERGVLDVLNAREGGVGGQSSGIPYWVKSTVDKIIDSFLTGAENITLLGGYRFSLTFEGGASDGFGIALMNSAPIIGDLAKVTSVVLLYLSWQSNIHSRLNEEQDNELEALLLGTASTASRWVAAKYGFKAGGAACIGFGKGAIVCAITGAVAGSIGAYEWFEAIISGDVVRQIERTEEEIREAWESARNVTR